MGTYYAAVEAYDPDGQSLMDEGGIYGGEARFFVLEAEDLIVALATLADSMVENGLRLDRILHAGAVGDFDDEMIGFEVDIDGMVETVEETEEICVTEAHVFEPDETDVIASGVFACCVDAFDPEWADEDEGDYAGHYQLAVIKADSASDALQILMEGFASEGIDILALEGLVDAAAFPFDGYEYQFEEDDAIAEVQDVGGMILSNAYAYPPESPDEVRRLDS